MRRRGSGILIHLTSLPSPFGIGDMGPWAYRFADFLAESKQSFWQILPLNPTDPAHNNSPYHSLSAFACNPLLISPEIMIGDDLLRKAGIETSPVFLGERVDYQTVIALKEDLFNKANERCKKKKQNQEDQKFCLEK
jgi:4-alpha-glucanotransferase